MKTCPTFCRLLLAIAAISSSNMLFAKRELVSNSVCDKNITRSVASAPEWNISSVWDAKDLLDKMLKEDISKSEAEALRKVKDAVDAACKKDASEMEWAKAWEAVDCALEELGVEYATPTRKKTHHKEFECCPSLRSGIIKLLLEVQKEVRECCKDLQSLINSKFPCELPKPIHKVPATIHCSGKYCVTKDLVYKGTGTAITIDADNVTIDFNNHDLTLLDPAATGIGGTGHSELVIKHDKIQASVPSSDVNSFGIHLINFEKVAVENCFFKNTRRGVQLENCKDVTLKNCHFDSHRGAGFTGNGANFLTSNSINLENCSAENTDNAYAFSESSRSMNVNNSSANNCSRCIVTGGGEVTNVNYDLSVTNCQFNEFSRIAFLLNNLNGCIVDNCASSSTIPLPASMMQIGFGGNQATVENYIITNSAFNGVGAIDNLDAGIPVFDANNIIIDNCSVSYLGFPAIGIGNIYLDKFGPQNVTVKNCTLAGTIGVSVDTSLAPVTHGVYVENNHIESTSSNGIFVGEGVNTVVIKDNVIQNGLGNGINITGYQNSIEGNTITNNALSGVLLDATSTKNVVANNTLISNGPVNIVDNGTFNVASGNISL